MPKRNGRKTALKKTPRPAPRAAAPQTAEKNVRKIARIEQQMSDERLLLDRISDQMTRMAGSASFLIINALGFALWVVLNSNFVPGLEPFDPFPFGFLTFLVSLEAIFLAIFVLISQNHMNQRADRRAHLDLQINLLAEQETTKVLAMLKKIASKLGIANGADLELSDLSRKTDANRIWKELDERLPEAVTPKKEV